MGMESEESGPKYVHVKIWNVHPEGVGVIDTGLTHHVSSVQLFTSNVTVCAFTSRTADKDKTNKNKLAIPSFFM